MSDGGTDLKQITEELISSLESHEKLIIRAVLEAKPRKYTLNKTDRALLLSGSDGAIDSFFFKVHQHTEQLLKIAARRLRLPLSFVKAYYAVAIWKMRHGRAPSDDYIDYQFHIASSRTPHTGTADTVNGAPSLLLPPSLAAIKALTPELMVKCGNRIAIS